MILGIMGHHDERCRITDHPDRIVSGPERVLSEADEVGRVEGRVEGESPPSADAPSTKRMADRLAQKGIQSGKARPPMPWTLRLAPLKGKRDFAQCHGHAH
jgi:hypothetical protein